MGGFLYVLAVIFALAAFGLFSIAQSAIHEGVAAIVMLSAVACFCAAAVIGAIKHAGEKGRADPAGSGGSSLAKYKV